MALTVARRSYSVGSGAAKVTADLDEATRAVAEGAPIVLVGEDASVLGEALRQVPDLGRRELLLAVMVGDPADPAVMLAAQEMAGELWPWARAGDAGRRPAPGEAGPHPSA